MGRQGEAHSDSPPRGNGRNFGSSTKTRVALFALILVVAISSCFNAYLLLTARHYFEATAVVRLDPAGLKVYASERATRRPGPPVLVLFGDSRALMWPEPSRHTGYQMVNHGIAFQTTAQMLLRVDADVLQTHPTVVVIEGGINDLKTIADFPDRRREIVADCEVNLESIVERCRQAAKAVVVVTLFGIGDVALWRRPFWSNDVANAVVEVNADLRKLAGEKVFVLDADPVLADARHGIRRAYQIDQLHLSSAGYAALNEELVPLLAALPK